MGEKTQSRQRVPRREEETVPLLAGKGEIARGGDGGLADTVFAGEIGECQVQLG